MVSDCSANIAGCIVRELMWRLLGVPLWGVGTMSLNLQSSVLRAEKWRPDGVLFDSFARSNLS